jgi:hypothetical protein
MYQPANDSRPKPKKQPKTTSEKMQQKLIQESAIIETFYDQKGLNTIKID